MTVTPAWFIYLLCSHGFLPPSILILFPLPRHSARAFALAPGRHGSSPCIIYDQFISLPFVVILAQPHPPIPPFSLLFWYSPSLPNTNFLLPPTFPHLNATLRAAQHFARVGLRSAALPQHGLCARIPLLRTLRNAAKGARKTWRGRNVTWPTTFVVVAWAVGVDVAVPTLVDDYRMRLAALIRWHSLTRRDGRQHMPRLGLNRAEPIFSVRQEG